MKIAFIHNEKKLNTGAGQINDLISNKLKERDIFIQHFYPKSQLTDAPTRLKGLQNILFFHSLLDKKCEILKFDIIQGTTYTPISFLNFQTPIVSHFGSTTQGFLNAVPRTNKLEKNLEKIWKHLKQYGAIKELNIKTRRPMRDISEIETYVAKRADLIIATSNLVAKELITMDVEPNKIQIVHNAIENIWFEKNEIPNQINKPYLIYLGRLGNDVFTLKLKGLDRLIWLYQNFKDTPKLTIAISTNKQLVAWLKSNIPSHTIYTNLIKQEIKPLLNNKFGSIILVTSRYEGFCLSLIEGMSQGLIPISFPVGIAPEIIINGINGYLVNSHEEAKKCIDTILKDDALRLSLAQNAQKTSLRFQSSIMVDKLIELYKKLIGDLKDTRHKKWHRRLPKLDIY